MNKDVPHLTLKMPQMTSQVLLESVQNDIWKSLLRYFLPFFYSFGFCGDTASVTCLCPQLCQSDQVKDVIQNLAGGGSYFF